METISLLEAEFPFFLYISCFIFGAVIGSFLNVVIYRMPLMLEAEWLSQATEIIAASKESDNEVTELTEPEDEPVKFNLAYPNSHCPNCNAAIKSYQNIPIFSYIFLGGRCASCNHGISLRYPLVEFFTGLATVLVIAMVGANLSGLVLCFFVFALIALSLIDFDHKILPDDITLPLLWAGLVANYFELFTGFANAFWGAVLGYMSLWSVYQVFRLVTGKEGMGFGDFKLLAVLGAWLGAQMLPLIIILSSLAGAIIGGGLILFGRDKNNPIPFGPYLAIAGFIALLWGSEITTAYLRYMA